jgi:macrolide transport system ATP-binding/permease protein
MELLRRLSYLLNRRRLEREMAEEMAYHRELMSPDERGNFGDELRLREDAREMWGWTWLDRLQQDLAYGARVLRNAPGFTLTAMLILVLGIGVPLSAFRLVFADLQGGPVPDPDSLVRLTRRAPGAHATHLTYPELSFYAAHAGSFRSVIAVSSGNQAVFGQAATTTPETNPESISVTFATSNYFPEFGITPALGRVLTADDERPDGETAAMVGDLFWQRRLGGDPSVIGQTIRINGKLVRVVGVMPHSPRARDDVWIPLVRQPDVVQGSTMLTDWNSALVLYGRLRPEISAEASQQETLALAARLRESRPDHIWKDEYLEARPVLALDTNSEEFKIMLTAAALVLLLLVAACANLGTLVLARGVTREREIRVRLALGASRLRIVRQLFTESLLLAIISGLCALLFSSIVLRVMQLKQQAATGSLAPDWRALVATFVATVLAALVFGLPPAFRLASLVPRAGRARAIFLGMQVAVSCLLLVVSSLLVNSAQRLGTSDPGFDYRHLVAISPGLQTHGYGEAATHAYFDQLRARTAALPDVQAVSQAWLAPWGGLHMGASWMGRNYAGNRVDPQFLDTMGIRLIRGRNFRAGDSGVALVNEDTARLLWPDGDALGRSLPWDPQQTVIGVVGNASTGYVGDPEPLEYYVTASRADAPDSVLLVRVAGSPRHVVRVLQDTARSLDERLQPTVQVVTDTYDQEIRTATAALAVIATLGTVSILLSVIGLAGLAGYIVAQRTREIGLRIALGARASHVVGAILAPMSRPIVFGFICGALGGSAVASVLRSGIPTMSGIDVYDPVPYMMALLLFAAVVALSILPPGRRATHIDPLQALKQE